ncbi:uncharacterized protein LOC124148068 [Haliotis rufescens]|uniref:uncharacterized protein LOC124148068 n=1 Tax=Haliotis rufescens TaxID=6454 RepID=UPI001EB09F86|nr:uncharacterized protein LOC124148068 [Haliotis rufescens]
MIACSSLVLLLVIGLVSPNPDVDTTWMKTTLQNYFSKPRHHATHPTYKAEARDFIMKEFKSYGLETHSQRFDTNLVPVKGVNIIAMSKGKNFGTFKDQIVGVAAHYDTMRDTPGVDDNGAAVVGMLQAAKHLAKFTRDFTVVFVAFDFEEWENRGLPLEACGNLSCGSRKFLSDWVPTFWSTTPVVKGVVVMDTIFNIQEMPNTQQLPPGLAQLNPGVVNSINSDGKKGDFIAAIGRAYDSDVLDAFVTSYTALGQPGFELEKINITALTGPTVTPQQFMVFQDFMRSDHYTFWSNGIKAIFLTDTANFRGYMEVCYHHSCDNLSRMTDKMLQFLGKTTQAVIGTVNKLAPSTGHVSGAGIPGNNAVLLACLVALYSRLAMPE